MSGVESTDHLSEWRININNNFSLEGWNVIEDGDPKIIEIENPRTVTSNEQPKRTISIEIVPNYTELSNLTKTATTAMAEGVWSKRFQLRSKIKGMASIVSTIQEPGKTVCLMEKVKLNDFEGRRLEIHYTTGGGLKGTYIG